MAVQESLCTHHHHHPIQKNYGQKKFMYTLIIILFNENTNDILLLSFLDLILEPP